MDWVLDPVILSFFTVLAVIVAATFIGISAINARAETDALNAAATRDLYLQWLATLKASNVRSDKMDEDYKALVESYLRETGKVWVRPSGEINAKLRPPEPSAFRTKPPPLWSPPIVKHNEGSE